ncbi:MAG: class I SAM-dependent methyltransferase [Vicinamibacteria bacterium]|jgi:SAM-dependent methyltransferase
MDTMSSFYRLAYRVGFTPWEDAEQIPEFADSLGELVARDENGNGPPHGAALELGCGSGIWGIHLARRGWQVTSIDLVEKALSRARDRVRDAGADVRLVQGDVTALRDAGVGSGFRLVLDTGTFHGLAPAQRAAVGREVSAVAAADATVVLLAWNPRRRGPLPRGVSQAGIEAAFPGWSVTDEGETGYPPPKPLRAEERWYRLRRG